MFIDEIEFKIKAGNGGNGVVRWRHEKGKEFSGPSGGNGGKGGDVYIESVSDVSLLSKYRNKKSFSADKGGDGMRNSMHGKDGDDLVILLPVGSIVTNKETKKSVSLEEVGEKKLLLSGGRGGLGNEHFKSSKNVSPEESTLGRSGEEGNFLIELELIASAGIIGLPNAGKSSLLNSLTEADSKVGDFPFTTLEPNLGNFHGKILADIPGLIEGASSGKGLGYKFLRHIKRTKILIHCISSESENVSDTYEMVRSELGKYDKTLLDKKELIVITKSDLLDDDTISSKVNELKSHNSDVTYVSVIDENLLKSFKSNLSNLLEN